MPQAGKRIGPYTLVRQLGRGAFGLVWLAERRGAFATTQVALKIALEDEPDLDAIAQESQLWAQLGGHPNVLPIIEADKYDQYIVIVSEYAPDGTLNSWLKKHNGIAPSIEAAVAMTIGILNGLEHLHSKKIIHRDLKPANILLQGDAPRLADFGLARVLKSSLKSGGVAGTPAYMAPEVFDGERSVGSDLWSVGVILYQMLSGRLPFPQSDLMALLGAIIKSKYENLPDYIPFTLAQVVARALQKNPMNRYQSVAEMRSALQSVASSGDIMPVTLRIIDDKPTLVVDTAKQTNPEQTIATLPHLPLGNSSFPSKQNANRTIEQAPARITQAEVSQNIPATEKYSFKNLEPEFDKLTDVLKYKTATAMAKRIGIFAVLFLAGWAVLSLLPGSFGAFFPFPFLSARKSEKINNIDKNTNILSSLPIPLPKVELVDSSMIKDSNKLAVEIGKRLALLEKELSNLPKGTGKTGLQEAFEGIRDDFEEISLEDVKPEEVKILYEGYIFALDNLIMVAGVIKSEFKSKTKAAPTVTSEAITISNPALPPSPDIPVPDQKENVGAEFGKALEKEPSVPTVNIISIQDRLKDLKRMTKEVRQMRRDAKQKQQEEEQIEATEPPVPRRFMDKKAVREQERKKQ